MSNLFTNIIHDVRIAHTINSEYLENILIKKEVDDIKLLWGVAPTGPMQIGYITPISKLLDFMNLGFDINLIIADLHAYLDDKKSGLETLNIRTEYYEHCFKALGLRDDTIKYIYGTNDIHLNRDYLEELFTLSAESKLDEMWKSFVTTLRINDFPTVSAFIYTLMQILDVKYLNADLVLVGEDELPIYRYGKKLLKQAYNYNFAVLSAPVLHDITGYEKMSCSNKDRSIVIHDPPNIIRDKVASSFCPPKSLSNNMCIDIVKYMLFPNIGYIDIDSQTVNNLENFLEMYNKQEISSKELKNYVSNSLIELLKPVREYFSDKLELIERAQSVRYDTYEV